MPIENNKPKENKPDTKTHILAVGHQLIAKKGFTALGLAELLKTAGVPKGSFYHYFASKEQFGQALIEYYFEHYFITLDRLFNSDKPAKVRLLDYFNYWLNEDTDCQGDNCCLVVKLSAEVADLSDAMRLALHQGCSQVIERLAQQLQAGYQDGSIQTQADAMQQAQCLYYLWLGADLTHKLAKDKQHLHTAMQQTQIMLNSQDTI